jgi:HD-like signal output (HDOD) protein
MPQAVSDVLDHLSSLPPFPKVTTRLLAMLDDDRMSVTDLAHVVADDPSLAMKVIHIANSPFYMLTRPVDTIQEAVLVLGINTMKHLSAAASVARGVAQISPRRDVFDMSAYWKHSYATAIVAQKFAKQSNARLAGSVYFAGLVHDVGKVILAYYWPEIWGAITTAMRSAGEPYHIAEQRFFGRTHGELTVQLCRNWRFPDSLVSLIDRAGCLTANSEAAPTGIDYLGDAHRIVGSCGYSFPLVNFGHESISSLPPAAATIAETLADEVEHELAMLEGKL